MIKKLLVKTSEGYEEMTIRSYEYSDVSALISLQKACFPPPFPEELLWSKEQLESHVRHFQEGALCAEINQKIIGSMTSLIVDFDPSNPNHKWKDVTDNGFIRNHKRNGNTLYIVDISVDPEYRKLGIGKWLMQTMYELVVHKKLERLLGGGRIPFYHQVKDEMTPEEYVESVLSGLRRDPVLSFLIQCGRIPIGVVRDYLDDEESGNCGVLMEWKNPFFNWESKSV